MNSKTGGRDAGMDFLSSAAEVPNDKLKALASREEVLMMSLMLKDKDIAEQAIDGGLTHACFQNKITKKLFVMAAEHLNRHDAVLSRPALESILASTSSPEEAGMFRNKYDSIVGEFGVKSTDFSMLKENIEGRYVQRQAYAICQKFLGELLESTRDQKKIVASFQTMANEIQSFGVAKQFEQIAQISDIMDELKAELIDRRDNPTKFHGIKCLYKNIDADYNGFQKQRYMIITGTEGGGKTTFMINLARNFAIGGANVVYVTIESLNKDIARRVLTIESQVSYTRLMRGGSDPEFGLSPHIMKELDMGADRCRTRLGGGRFHLVQVLEGTGREHICRMIQRIRAVQQVDVVFIDYLQVVAKETNFGERIDQAIAEVSNKFRAWGRTNNCLMVTASQIKSDKGRKLQEKVENEDDVIITKGDTSGSKELAGAADYMFGIWLPLSKDRMIVFPTKHRQGKEVPRYTFSFEADSGRVSQLEEFGDSEAVAKVVSDKTMRERLRKKLDSSDATTNTAIPGTRKGETVPDEVLNSVQPGAGTKEIFGTSPGGFLDDPEDDMA